MFQKRGESVFSRATTLISIIIAIFGLIGIYLTPKNFNFILLGIVFVILVVLVIDKVDQINVNSMRIKEINKKFEIEERFKSLENELAEQRGKLSMVVNKE